MSESEPKSYKMGRADRIFWGFVIVAILGIIPVYLRLSWGNWIVLGGFGLSLMTLAVAMDIFPRLHIRHK